MAVPGQVEEQGARVPGQERVLVLEPGRVRALVRVLVQGQVRVLVQGQVRVLVLILVADRLHRTAR